MPNHIYPLHTNIMLQTSNKSYEYVFGKTWAFPNSLSKAAQHKEVSWEVRDH